MTRMLPQVSMHRLYILTCFLFSSASAQSNITQATLYQDLTTIAAFPSQKPCARDCFVSQTPYCNKDNIGVVIGCTTHFSCLNNGWQATNRCFCRLDLQTAAQQYLTSCIRKSCTVGDVGIDASSAGSIYAQYCAEKNASPVVPASVFAIPTTSGGTSLPAGGGGGTSPASDPTTNANSPSSGSSTLSTGAIVGIAVGGFIVLVVLLSFLNRCVRYRHISPKVVHANLSSSQDLRHMHAMDRYDDSWHTNLAAQRDIAPEDSRSMASGPAWPAPTIMSGSAPPREQWGGAVWHDDRRPR